MKDQRQKFLKMIDNEDGTLTISFYLGPDLAPHPNYEEGTIVIPTPFETMVQGIFGMAPDLEGSPMDTLTDGAVAIPNEMPEE